MTHATAFRGHISENSLAISTDIVATAYTVCKPEFLHRPGFTSMDAPLVLVNGEPMWADGGANALDFLLDAGFLTRLMRNVGAEAGIFSR